MSDDFWLNFQEVIVEVEGGFSAGILFEGHLIQDKTICKTKRGARKRRKFLRAKFIQVAETAAREIDMTIDTMYHTDIRDE